MMFQLTIAPLQQAALPVLSRTTPGEQRRATYVYFTKLSGLIAYPAFAGMMVLAPIMVPLVFGPRWVEAGVFLRVICFVIVPLHFNVMFLATLSRIRGILAAHLGGRRHSWWSVWCCYWHRRNMV